MKKLAWPFRLFFWLLFLFLEWLGLRCSKCGSWRNTKSIVRELNWGSSVDGAMLMDPFWLKTEERKCDDCNHVLTSEFAGTAEVGNLC